MPATRVRDRRRVSEHGWAPHLVRNPGPCPAELEPPVSDPAWLDEALKYARNTFEEDILKGIIPLSLKGWMRGRVGGHKPRVLDERTVAISMNETPPEFKANRQRLHEFLLFLSVKAKIPCAVAVRNRREFVLVLGWWPEDLASEVTPGVACKNLPSEAWCPSALTPDFYWDLRYLMDDLKLWRRRRHR